jgi:hypothetical protein
MIMYSQSDIEDAVAGGAVTAEQAASLRNFVATRNGAPVADEEYVRWSLGFNDLYIYVSSIFLMIGLAWVGSKVDVGGRGPSFVAPLLVALAAWGLGELFARKKRLALAAIVFAYVFVWAVFLTLMFLTAEMLGSGASGTTRMLVTAICALLAAGAAFLHWKRFAEPIDVALGTGAVAMAVMSLLGAALGRETNETVVYVALIVLGLATLVYAMTWEAKDPRRETARADIAFWLQFVAAFEVIVGVVGLLGMMRSDLSTGGAIAGILVFIVLALLGLALGRRVWPLLGAWPLGVGIYALLRGDPYSSMDEFGMSGSGYGDMDGSRYSGSYGGGPFNPYGGMGDSVDNMMLTCLIIGIVLLLLGMFWSQIRGAVVGVLPEGLRARVPGTGRQTAAEAQTFN